MSRSPLINVCLLLLVAMNAIKGAAQTSNARYQAPLNAVTADGFYRIAVTPAMLGQMTSPNDLRILDRKGQQVPYLLHSPNVFVDSLQLPVGSIQRDTSGQYFVIIENEGRSFLDQVVLEMEHTSAVRALTLSGSDDGHTWYAIREDFYWDLMDEASGSRSFSFPSNHYRYLKLMFNGAGRLPVKVNTAKAYRGTTVQRAYTRLPDPVITQRDTGRKTLVRLQLDHRYALTKLELDIAGPRYFHRTAEIYGDEKTDVLNHDFLTTLSSGIQSIALDQLAVHQVCIEIDNKDNPPLTIRAARLFADQDWLIAYLEKGQRYTLAFGDSTARAPDYDLSFFKDSIGRQIPELGIGAISRISAAPTAAAHESRSNQWIIWPVLVLLLGGLLYVTLRMVKQLNREPR